VIHTQNVKIKDGTDIALLILGRICFIFKCSGTATIVERSDI